MLIPNNLIVFDTGPSAKFECREDESSMIFLQLILTEVGVKIGVFIAMAALGVIVNKGILKKKVWKVVFRESEEIVWILNY